MIRLRTEAAILAAEASFNTREPLDILGEKFFVMELNVTLTPDLYADVKLVNAGRALNLDKPQGCIEMRDFTITVGR